MKADTQDKRERKKGKQYLRRILLMGVLLVGIFGVINVLNRLLVEPEEWSRFVLYHFEHREEPIDQLWLGSSHVYRDINPDIMDELSGQKNFNLSTSAQDFSQSFLLLQEADKKYELKHVYLEMYFRIHLKEREQEYYNVATQFKVWDYLPDSEMKQQMITNYDPDGERPAVYMPFVRYRKYIFDSDHISARIREREDLDHTGYKTDTGMKENGYWKMDNVMAERGCVRTNQLIRLEEEPLSEAAENYLLQIITYCRENEIELTLFSSPMPELSILSEVQDYDNYVNKIRRIAEEYSLEYYDFNLCREEYLPIGELDYYMDWSHLNDAGVSLFTPVLYDVVTNDRADYFYDSYEEKLKQTEPSFYGLIRNGEDENGKMQYEIASNRENGIEYRIEFVPDMREYECEIVQEYEENKYFIYQSEYEGTFLISARCKGETEPFKEMQIAK